MELLCNIWEMCCKFVNGELWLDKKVFVSDVDVVVCKEGCLFLIVS